MCMLALLAASPTPRDPGLRPGADAGGMRPDLTRAEQALFLQGRTQFVQVEQLRDGLGPRFNLDSCGGCHAQPAVGGTSPATNPQVALATLDGADNTVPAFITPTGPIREMRFRRDNAVHQLFVVSGRQEATADARDCPIKQPVFPSDQLAFRMPTPVFGAGLIEQIPDAAIVANQQRDDDGESQDQDGDDPGKAELGIHGTVQPVGDHIGRFGWKAQHFSLENFAGEAYNVEMGITNELSPTELDATAPHECQFAPVPNSLPPADGGPSDVELFAAFMRGLSPPTPSPSVPGGAASIRHGAQVFRRTGCAACHTPQLGEVPLFSDLLLHHMGRGLDEGITQGQASGDQFRTAPLWGVGQRLFFLHDGRTRDLLEAVRAHASAGSEARAVMARFNTLDAATMQDLLNFLRSL
jgi:CxxC motif-containing protein (DUF1111 family)